MSQAFSEIFSLILTPIALQKKGNLRHFTYMSQAFFSLFRSAEIIHSDILSYVDNMLITFFSGFGVSVCHIGSKKEAVCVANPSIKIFPRDGNAHCISVVIIYTIFRRNRKNISNIGICRHFSPLSPTYM